MNTADFLIGVVFLALVFGVVALWRKAARFHAECVRRAALKRWIEREYPDS